MNNLIESQIKKLKRSIKDLKGTKGMNRDVRRENNKLTEYKISQLQTCEDVLNDIEHICQTTDFGQIDTKVKKLIKDKDDYKNKYLKAKGYEDKYNQLKAKVDNSTTKPAPRPTLDLDDYKSNLNATNNSDNNKVQSDQNTQDNQGN